MSNPSFDGSAVTNLDTRLNLATRLQRRLTSGPRICVMGEVNAGKSSVVNLLAGIPVMPTSITANTWVPIRLFYAEKPELSMELGDRTRLQVPVIPRKCSGHNDAVMLHVGLPVGTLKEYNLIDTPGFQSGEDAVCQRAFSTCRHAHLAIWCTTATQAWKATEAAAWLRIPARIKANSILAVTFKDTVETTRDQSRLWDRIRAQAAPHFADVVMVSARDGLAARGLSDANQRDKLWHLSGAAELTRVVGAAVETFKTTRELAVKTRLSAALLSGVSH